MAESQGAPFAESGLPDLANATTFASLVSVFTDASGRPTASPTTETVESILTSLLPHFIRIQHELDNGTYEPSPPPTDIADWLDRSFTVLYWAEGHEQLLARPSLRLARLLLETFSRIVNLCRYEPREGESLAGGSRAELGDAGEWRAGKREWRKGMAEVGGQWEWLRGGLLDGLSTHLDGLKTDEKNAPERTVVREELYDFLVKEFVDPAVSGYERQLVGDILCFSISKHNANKGVLRQLLPSSLLGRLLATSHDRAVARCAFELAFRLSPSNKQNAPDQINWVTALFPPAVFGTDAQDLRLKFNEITSATFEDRVTHLLTDIATGHVERSQPFSTPRIDLLRSTKPNEVARQFLSDDTPQTSAGGGPGLLGWYINRWSITAIVNIEWEPVEDDSVEDDGEAYPCRFEIDYSTIDRLTLVEDKLKDELRVEILTWAPPRLAGGTMPLFGKTSQSAHSVRSDEKFLVHLAAPIGDHSQEAELVKCFNDRAQLYPNLSVDKAVPASDVDGFADDAPKPNDERAESHQRNLRAAKGSVPMQSVGTDYNSQESGKSPKGGDPPAGGSADEQLAGHAARVEAMEQLLSEDVTDETGKSTKAPTEAGDNIDDGQRVGDSFLAEAQPLPDLGGVAGGDLDEDKPDTDTDEQVPPPKRTKKEEVTVKATPVVVAKSPPALRSRGGAKKSPTPALATERKTRSTSNAPVAQPAPVVVPSPPANAPAWVKLPSKAKARPAPPSRGMSPSAAEEENDEMPPSTLEPAKKKFDGATYGKERPERKIAPRPTRVKAQPKQEPTPAASSQSQRSTSSESLSEPRRSTRTKKRAQSDDDWEELPKKTAPVKTRDSMPSSGRQGRAKSTTPPAKATPKVIKVSAKKTIAHAKVATKAPSAVTARPKRSTIKPQGKAGAMVSTGNTRDEARDRPPRSNVSGSTDYDEIEVSRAHASKRKRVNAPAPVESREPKKVKVSAPAPALAKVKPATVKKKEGPKKLTDSERAKLKAQKEKTKPEKARLESATPSSTEAEDDVQAEAAPKKKSPPVKSTRSKADAPANKRKSHAVENDEVPLPVPGESQFSTSAAAKAVLDKDRARQKPQTDEPQPKKAKIGSVKELLAQSPAQTGVTQDVASASASVGQVDEAGEAQADGYQPPADLVGLDQPQNEQLAEAELPAQVPKASLESIEDSADKDRAIAVANVKDAAAQSVERAGDDSDPIESDSHPATQPRPKDAAEETILVNATPSDAEIASAQTLTKSQPLEQKAEFAPVKETTPEGPTPLELPTSAQKGKHRELQEPSTTEAEKDVFLRDVAEVVSDTAANRTRTPPATTTSPATAATQAAPAPGPKSTRSKSIDPPKLSQVREDSEAERAAEAEEVAQKAKAGGARVNVWLEQVASASSPAQQPVAPPLERQQPSLAGPTRTFPRQRKSPAAISPSQRRKSTPRPSTTTTTAPEQPAPHARPPARPSVSAVRTPMAEPTFATKAKLKPQPKKKAPPPAKRRAKKAKAERAPGPGPGLDVVAVGAPAWVSEDEFGQSEAAFRGLWAAVVQKLQLRVQERAQRVENVIGWFGKKVEAHLDAIHEETVHLGRLFAAATEYENGVATYAQQLSDELEQNAMTVQEQVEAIMQRGG